ncbi:patatin-like phospholipase family protein [Novosphingobium mangrovi (ex Huang et al. 2023)]|uniref:Patatin-like phospholipase family protein n=1 Tax=Novosphingobium mangrovi (ex Huang et al. 2023) TaxID=2976432 RepID=A0ABT2I3A2_9SPHN|nr:patatin-like phospholipase family protein [Novosphingobium mangrovi (ex Huang et al. 2023)]MCT2399290.1 patatin-like phospholipase family protein [Novosphingobium mangrovi (ex Huang et al. 2023)]
MKAPDSARHTDPQCVLVLQGGGALGAYQAGVCEALGGRDVHPDWVAGISIGAINAAIIAGNAPGDRVGALRRFWEHTSSELLYRLDEPIGFARRAFNEVSALYAATFGLPGFFHPRVPMPMPEWPAEIGRLSFYDTTPLRATLLELVDFDRINHGKTRFSVGAVNVLNGNFAYFDNTQRRIGPEHVMASGALPPGFPPVEIDGEWYWDGGLVSNTPLQYVLDNRTPCEMTVFQVDLFSSRGSVPRTMADIDQRVKDIRYSSRTRLGTDTPRQMQKMRAAARRLAHKLPDEFRDDPDMAALLDHHPEGAVAVMHLINRTRGYETNSKDYEFSRMTVEEHWAAGRADALYSLAHPEWTGRSLEPDEIMTFDLAGDRLEKPLTVSNGEHA